MTLGPEAEALLRSYAVRHGLPPEEAIMLLLAATDAAGHYNPAEAETIFSDIQASRAAGYSMTIDEYCAKALARRQVRGCE